MTISLDKKYTTRGGRPVRIYAADGRNGEIHGAVDSNMGWVSATWDAAGHFLLHSESSVGIYSGNDLIELKPKRRVTGWLNIDPSFRPKEPNAQGLFESREIADSHALSTRIACIHIDVETEDLSHG